MVRWSDLTAERNVAMLPRQLPSEAASMRRRGARGRGVKSWMGKHRHVTSGSRSGARSDLTAERKVAILPHQ